ncbi:MAG: sensor histidine kinase [Chloroflexi bacterium]|nr:sensor histidine kinase [Chloroflexota bacterium]
MPPTESNALPRLRELASESEKEREQLDVEMREIDILVKQTGGEIDRLQQRQTDSASRMRELEANLESFSRADVKSAYAAAQDSQMRLFMMRSQLEQLQGKQRSLQRYRAQLEKLSALAVQIAEAPPAGVAGARGGGIDRQSMVHIIEAQEAERQRLSREMHDGPAQSLTNLILQAEIVERLFEADPARARGELGNLKTSANATFQRIREFIFELRPMMLDDLGLLPTLKRYVQTFEAKNKLPTQLTIQGERALAPYIEVTFFRAIQELLSNAARHAHAARVLVTLDLQNNPVSATVEDDGSGFDVAAVLEAARERGRSTLANLEKRIEMLGGRLQMQSGTGRGTKARIELPSK